ncbi:MAG: FAD-dependent oxidoreductase [Gammaproteobacteria bacterium]|nr:FAD-dependent oxidoreductase [Gammaproteobacteria bacterium]
MDQNKIAIIGSGAAGMACGYFLHNKYDITVFEQNNYIGGHANTAIVETAEETVYTDTAFVIFNEENYPLFTRMLKELNVASIQCPMSFSFKIMQTGWEYNSKGFTWFPTNLKNLASPRFRSLLKETGRFYKEATEIYRDKTYADLSIAQYLEEKGYSRDFIDFFMIPVIAVVWSIPPEDMLNYPALTMIEFLENHGAFQGVFGQKRWRTVLKGSQSYKQKVTAGFKDKIQLNNQVISVRRSNGKALISDSQGQTHEFDRVIFACHADQALALLADPTPDEQKTLGSFRYNPSHVILHSDAAVLPAKRYMWAGWNYLTETDGRSSFTYYMNKLQRVSKKQDYFITLNDTGRINPDKIIREYDYEHPIFDHTAVTAQTDVPGLNENGVSYFCGSYTRYGFHEDAFRSGVEVCRKITGEPIWES